MRVLVTGGTGFLGRHVVRGLLEAGAEVRCLVRPSSDTGIVQSNYREFDRNLEFVCGDLTRPDTYIAALADCDTVFHLAAELSGATASLFLSNVVGTRRLIEGSTKQRVKRFVMISSIAVYDTAGLQPGAIVNEEVPLDPKAHLRDPYTYSKVRQENVAWEAHSNLSFPLVVIRPGNLYGPGRDCLGGRVGIRLGRLMVVMDGKQRMPYTHVKNCAAAIVKAGSQEGIEGSALNIVDDELPTARELTRRYRSEIGGIRHLVLPGWAVSAASRLNLWYHRRSRGQLPAILTPYKSRSMWRPLRYSNDRAKVVLGWKPEIELNKGLEETFAWFNNAHQSRN